MVITLCFFCASFSNLLLTFFFEDFFTFFISFCIKSSSRMYSRKLSMLFSKKAILVVVVVVFDFAAKNASQAMTNLECSFCAAYAEDR